MSVSLSQTKKAKVCCRMKVSCRMVPILMTGTIPGLNWYVW